MAKTTTVKSMMVQVEIFHYPHMPAGGPYSLVITNKKDRIQLKDILIGEVWLCGGQSKHGDGNAQCGEFLRWKETNPITR
jgi:hypothetical protein